LQYIRHKRFKFAGFKTNIKKLHKMNIPANLSFTRDHEWLKIEGEEALVGITDYAQSQLGDIVFVEVETEGEILDKGESFGTIEAVKTVEDMYMPVSGEILEFNGKLAANPDLLNKDPYGDGWVIRVKMTNLTETESLLNAKDYQAHLSSL
jgi:glycine cleavage system H protein